MKITFENLHRSAHHLSFTFLCDDHRFETSYWYEGVDFYELENDFGKDFLEKIYFHIMAFEFNKFLSLAPTEIDFGKYNSLITPAFTDLWHTIAQKVWAQWRYENDLPDYAIPEFPEGHFGLLETPAVFLKKGKINNLVFCGGGKDSLVSLKIMEEQNIPYGVFTYSHSIYGTAKKQHDLIGDLLNKCHPGNLHRQWIYDSFMDAPILKLNKKINIKSITAAETPSSIFAVLPVVLSYGYTNILLGHERSANKGNLIWEKTGEEVNHQWGKSFAAEVLMNNYIQQHLIANFSFFSLLQPVYDVVIFNLLRKNTEAVPFTHSCNIEKPWCKKCAKCAYVWLNYMAYLPTDLINDIFENINLFDLPENEIWFKQMLGMTEHTPFECIGQVEEVRLAFEICKRKGLTGKMMDFYSENIFLNEEEIKNIIEKYSKVYEEDIAYPAELKEKLLSVLNSGNKMAMGYFEKYFR